MEHPFLVAGIVLVSFIVLAQPKMWQSYGHSHPYKGHGHRQSSRKQRCYQIASRGDECDVDRRCAWNMRECPGYAHCHLICTNNPYKLCYGAEAEDACNGGGNFECWPDYTGQLACINTKDICSMGG